MKKTAFRLAAMAGVLILLACGAYALGSGDSLISLSYLNNTFLPSAVEQGTAAADGKLQETYDEAKSTLDALQQQYLGQSGTASGSYSATLQPRDWKGGDKLELTTGSGLFLFSGSVTVTHNGAFIDVTEGSEISSGSRLTEGHRYLVGEDTSASVSVSSGAAQIGVQGSYVYTAGGGSAIPFYDVSTQDWFYTQVCYAYENGLFSGVDAVHFGPYEAMDRAMLMTVLYQLAGAPEDELLSADASFRDVPDSAWYAAYVKWGAEQGITAGTGPNTFGPEQKVTREQIVVLLYSFVRNYLGQSADARADLSGYQDLSSASAWAQDAFAWAVAEGIVSSTSSGSLTLSPQNSATRAEVAAMLRVFAEKFTA